MDITADRQQLGALRDLTSELLLQGHDVEVTSLAGSVRTQRQQLETTQTRHDVSVCMVKFRPSSAALAQRANVLGKLMILDVGKHNIRICRTDDKTSPSLAPLSTIIIRITVTRCSAIAERPRCRMRYSFRQK